MRKQIWCCFGVVVVHLSGMGSPAASPAKPVPQLTPLFPTGNHEQADIPVRQQWLHQRGELRASWIKVLGAFPVCKPALKTAVLATESLPGFTRQHVQYQVEEGLFTDGFLLTPEGAKGKLPVVVVFHPTTPFGARGVAGLESTYPLDKWQGVHLVRRGYLVWCPRNFINAEGTNYAGNAVKVLTAHPGWTGMGRMTWDAIRAADFIETWPEADGKRIACLGHSLGAKQVLYAMAFDERYCAGVFSEGGIGLSFSNWDAPWYLGEQIKQPGFQREHHELIALAAPRPFFLIAGDSADDDRSRAFLEMALPIYDSFGAGECLVWLNHRKGHLYDAEIQAMVEQFLGKCMRH